MGKRTKDYLKMTAEELTKDTAALDTGAIPAGKPLSDEQRARWEKARAGGSASAHVGPGRPKVGEGAVPVPVSVEAGLLRRAIARAQALQLKRSEYFAKALQLLTDGHTEIGGSIVDAAVSSAPHSSQSGRKSGHFGHSVAEAAPGRKKKPAR